jgi:hypothetical protein
MRSSPKHGPCSTARVVQAAQRLLGRATSGDRHPARPGAHRRRSGADIWGAKGAVLTAPKDRSVRRAVTAAVGGGQVPRSELSACQSPRAPPVPARYVGRFVVLTHERLHRVEGFEPHQGHELNVVFSLAPDQVDEAEPGNAPRLDARDHFPPHDALIRLSVVLGRPASPHTADHDLRAYAPVHAGNGIPHPNRRSVRAVFAQQSGMRAIRRSGLRAAAAPGEGAR